MRRLLVRLIAKFIIRYTIKLHELYKEAILAHEWQQKKGTWEK